VKTQQTDTWLRVLPLGGLGHIGGNMMVYETADDLVMVDCGVLFPTVEEPGIDYVVPDIRYILQRKRKFRGIVLTHGHEDHVGALPFLLPMLGNTNLWGTRFTSALVRRKLEEFPDIAANVLVIEDKKPFRAGRLTMTPHAVTHSIPDSVGLAIDTPVGTVVHTGDFKLDLTPLDGRPTDEASFRKLGDDGVVLLCSDSTNSLKPGRTYSEREVHGEVARVIKNAKQRVFFTTFASHIDRIQAVCDAAEAAGRKVLPLGRSMRNNIGTAREVGVLKAKPSLFLQLEAFPSTRPENIVVLASGSQGEPFSSMSRISQASYEPIEIDAGDMVVFSSRKIPGNERAISTLANSLVRQGASIVGDHEARVHSSGHAFADEQADMIDWCRPKAMLPIHGELRHLVVHGELAVSRGVDEKNVFVHEDGWPLLLVKQDGEVSYHREPRVDAGLLFVDGKGVGDIGEIVLRDRKQLGEAGIVACVVVLTHERRLALPPTIVTRGTVYVDENEALLERATRGVRQQIEAEKPKNNDDLRELIRRNLRRFFKQTLGRKPMVVPVVLVLPSSCCE
jgi:ribonuclease J